MKEYHKIQTVFKRDPDNKYKTLLEGQYSLPEFEFLDENPWIWTEKVDGTNIRVMWDGSMVSFGGKTDRAQVPTDLFMHLVKTFTEDAMARAFGTEGDVCLYGEGFGAGIQKGGGNYSATKGFVLFDVHIGEWWLERGNVIDIANSLNIPFVPSLRIGSLVDMVEFVREGFQSKWGPFPAEGIVARPTVELKTRSGHRIITKLKTKDFRT